jgi:3-isopropylmalate/(R)-2-methylmalate dehydratase small subunit
MMIIEGTVVKKYGDDINTDYIIPAYLLQESWDPQFFADHAFERYDPTFVSACRANKNNVIVAGNNFGCGSSREQAVYAIKNNDVVAVVAQSFPDIFFRNSLNNKLLPVQVKDTSSIAVGDRLIINLEKGLVEDLSTTKKHEILGAQNLVQRISKGDALDYARARLRAKLRETANQV